VKSNEEQAFSVIGISVRTNNAREMSGSDGLIGPLWYRFMSENLAAGIPHRADDTLLAINTEYASDENGDYSYWIAARVTSVDDVPPGFSVMTIPAGHYAVLTSERGPVQKVLPAIWKRIWAMSPGELGGERAFRADYEIYPAESQPHDAQVEIHLGIK
jgi:predicted transcriptional regulator YdeE